MTDSDKDIVVNFYDEGSPVQLNMEEQRRVERVIKEEGITKGSVIRDKFGYIRIVVREFLKGSKYQRGREAKRIAARDREHLTSVGQDNSEGGES